METKKRALIFVPRFPMATETFIQREISQLAKRNVLDIQVLSMEEGNAECDPALAGRVTYKKPTVLDILISPYKLLQSFLTSPEKVKRVWLSLLGRDINVVKSFLILLKSVGYYAAVFAQLKPDFIYSHFLSEPSSVGMAVSLYLDIPFGISAHAKDILVEGQLIKNKVKNAKFINICNVNAWKYCIDQASGCDTSNVLVRYHGLDFGNVKSDFKKTDPDEISILINNSRMTAKKGQIYLLEAMKILHEKGINAKLAIISGGGDLKAQLKDFVSQNELESVVEFVNDGQPIPYERVEEYYNKGHVFVFPSIEAESGDADGVANVLIEAAAHKLPIVATDSGSASELVIDGKTGFVVPQKDSQALASAIEKVLKTKDEATEIVENAYNLAKEKFDLIANATLIEEAILKVIK